MKTLDEVIKGFEHCKSAECKECPYRILFDDDSHVPCDQFEKDDDALHYLVEYRACQQHMEVVEQIRQDAVRQRDAHIKALGDLNRNEPLTWEELRQFEGGPVYVKLLGTYEGYPNASRWMLVQSDVNFGNAWFIDRSGARYCFYEKDMNDIWQAFRKEK